MKKLLTPVAIILILGFGFFFLRNASITGYSVLDENLAVPLENTVKDRELFREEYLAQRSRTVYLGKLYEKYFQKIGLNGIMQTIEEENPLCHFEAHDLGKLIYQKKESLGESLRICDNFCYSGCMHGVLMQAFVVEEDPHEHENNDPHTHVDFSHVDAAIPEICNKDEMADLFIPGECAHGIGHAIMFLSLYDIKESMNHCHLFPDERMVYYCSTGLYMEYSSVQKGVIDPENLFEPCLDNEFPSACFFSKMGHIFNWQYRRGGDFEEIVNLCLDLDGIYRRSCFHGLGNFHQAIVATGYTNIWEVCDNGDDLDKQFCIEGLMQRMGKYNNKEALEACESQLEGKWMDLCTTAANQKLYGMDRPWDLYLET